MEQASSNSLRFNTRLDQKRGVFGQAGPMPSRLHQRRMDAPARAKEGYLGRLSRCQSRLCQRYMDAFTRAKEGYLYRPTWDCKQRQKLTSAIQKVAVLQYYANFSNFLRQYGCLGVYNRHL